MLWSSVLFAVFFYALTLAIGDFVSAKTKGIVSTVLVVGIIYVIGYFTGLVPRDTITNSGLLTIVSGFGMLAVVTNLGTMININQLIAEWKSVVVSLFGLAILGVIFYLVGVPLFGREYALAAFPPVAGGNVSTLMVSDAANEAGRTDIASFAWLLCVLQLFVGIPTAAFILRIYCAKLVKSERFKSGEAEKGILKKEINIRFLPAIPQTYNTSNVIMMKLLLVTWIASLLGNLTGISGAILCLVLGVVFCEIGFLDRNSLQSSGMMNLILFCMIAAAPANFASLTPENIGSMLLVVVVFLVIGAIALAAGGMIMGKLLRVNGILAAALSLNAMFGFPFNLMITEDIIRALNLSETEGERLREMVLPKMVVAGFTSVTVASVVIAGLVIPYIF